MRIHIKDSYLIEEFLKEIHSTYDVILTSFNIPGNSKGNEAILHNHQNVRNGAITP